MNTTILAVTFTDSADIADYAKPAISTMQKAGIISGKDDGSLAPTDNSSRAEAAKMVAVMLQGMVG